jgi:hypothetical protein
MKAPAFLWRERGKNMAAKQQNKGRYVTIRTTVWGRLTRMGLSRLARLILAELLHGDIRTNVKSGIFWPYHPMVIASIMHEPPDEVEAAMQELEEAGCIRMDTKSMLIWVREKWLHEWVNNQSYVTAIVNELEPMPSDSNIWPDVLGVFKAIQDRLAEADEENLKKRAAWFDPIIEVLKVKIGSKVNIESTEEGHMWLTHMSDTSNGHMCRTLTAIGLKGYRTRELLAKESKKGLTQARASVSKAVENFFVQYKKATGKEHPGISPSEKENILEGLDRIFASFEDVIDADPKLSVQATIEQFFKDWETGNLKGEDPTIWLFLTPEVWRMRAFRAGAIDTEEVFNRADGSVLSEEGK